MSQIYRQVTERDELDSHLRLAEHRGGKLVPLRLGVEPYRRHHKLATDLFSPGLSAIVFTLVGMTAAFLSGYVALRILLKLIEKGRLGGFAYYCWAVGLLAVVMGFVR